MSLESPFDLNRGQNTRRRVLLVEDEKPIRDVFRTMLQYGGYEVVQADDGDMAIDAVCGSKPPLTIDVIVTDIRMPKINGKIAIPYFLTRCPSVPIIVLTGYPDLHLRDALLKQGIVEYLVKPVLQEELLKAVASALEKQKMACYTRYLF
jgi:CheY-like chemotaxis protein